MTIVSAIVAITILVTQSCVIGKKGGVVWQFLIFLHSSVIWSWPPSLVEYFRKIKSHSNCSVSYCSSILSVSYVFLFVYKFFQNYLWYIRCYSNLFFAKTKPIKFIDLWARQLKKTVDGQNNFFFVNS